MATLMRIQAGALSKGFVQYLNQLLVSDSIVFLFFFFSSRRRHTRSLCDWSSDVCSSDLSEFEFDDGNGALTRLHYDHVVIACGAESNLGIIPGMTDHAFAFKVMRDAILLRQHIVRQMESAEATTDPDLRRWHLRFIIVGAGFSGVEVAGEINELVRSSTRFYRNFRKEDVVVSLVHS